MTSFTIMKPSVSCNLQLKVLEKEEHTLRLRLDELSSKIECSPIKRSLELGLRIPASMRSQMQEIERIENVLKDIAARTESCRGSLQSVVPVVPSVEQSLLPVITPGIIHMSQREGELQLYDVSTELPTLAPTETITFDNGSTFIGTINGESSKGTMTYWNGDVYTGDFHAGGYDGQGKLVYADGACYDGQWKRGEKHGVGINVFPPDDPGYYSGDWVFGYYRGEGEIYHQGVYFAGHFFNSCKVCGIEFRPDGSIYEGKVNRKGQRHGQGVLFRDGRWNIGAFVHDVKGKTQIFSSNELFGGGEAGPKEAGPSRKRSRETPAATAVVTPPHAVASEEKCEESIAASCDIVYEGSYNELGERHGQGTLCEAGGRYVGTFAKGRKHGAGYMLYADGRIFEGMFKDDVKVSGVTRPSFSALLSFA